VQPDPAGNRKLSKQKSHGRIDGAVALAMAMSVAGTYQDDGAGMDDYFKSLAAA
jgi:phage terminase large subunit-like protein